MGKTGKKAFTDPENTPAEMMEETLDRRLFTAEFDDVLLAFKLVAGADQKNCIINGWPDPVREHDAKVLEVEALIETFTDKQKEYKKKLRTLKNWETGWQLLNSRPDDLETYLELKAGMATFMDR